MVAGLVAVLIAAAVLGFIAYSRQKEQKAQHITAGESHDMGLGYREIEYKGEKYRYNALITTVLYAGIDSEGPMTVLSQMGFAPRSDSIAVVVLDKKHKKMSIIGINRDTMTEIRRLSLFGEATDYYVTNLEFAYAYGDGGVLSCEMLQEAVSKLLQVPINEYLITNRDSMKYINDIVDGVTVTVPNDDMIEIYPEMKKGAEVALDDINVVDYLRHRDITIDFSNEGRIDRQRSYIFSFITKLRTMLPDQVETIWKRLDDMSDYLQTSVTKNKYIQYANLLNTVGYDDRDYYKLEGEDRTSEVYDQFYVDEEALRQLVVDLFYEKV